MKTNKTERTRANLSPEDRRYVTEQSLSSQLSREKLADKLIGEITDKAGKHPQVETLKKMISAARNHESSFEESPWQLGVLHDHPGDIEYSIPPEALQIILEIQKNIYKNITVREVKWLTRIYKVLKGQPVPQFARNNEWWYYFNCYIWSSMYADREQVAGISGTSCDTSSLDSGLLEDASSIISKPVNQLNEDYANIFMDYIGKVLQFLMGANSTFVDAKQKEELGKKLAQTFEIALTGHSLRDFSEHESPGAGLAWLLYASFLVSAIRMGVFYRCSQDKSEVIILKLREKLPEFFEAYKQGSESFLKTAPKIWDSIKPKDGE